MSLKELMKPKASGRRLSLEAFLNEWAGDVSLNANVGGRIVRAIGKPQVIDTSKDPRLGRIFSNRTIYRYAPFRDLYGIEEPIHELVMFFTYASEGLQQARQIPYLVGPPGGGKSTITRIVRQCAEKEPVWVLGILEEGKTKPIPSPCFENPLGLFSVEVHGAILEERYRIPRSRLDAPMSRWAAQKLEERDGDMSAFVAMEIMPSAATRTCVARIDPGDAKTSDVGMLIGRAAADGSFEHYQYSGGLNRTTQGLLEFTEIFKADESLLNPLLGATADSAYAGAGDVGEMPYQGIVMAHSNPAEWFEFKEGKRNAALVDRIRPIYMPYCVRVTEEQMLYRHELDKSDFRTMPCSPRVLDIAAHFAVRTRVADIDDDRELRVRIYDGQSVGDLPERDRVKKADDLRKSAEWQEGMFGVPTRFILNQLPVAATWDTQETGLDPVILYQALERALVREDLPEIEGVSPLEILEHEIAELRNEIIADDVRRAYVENLAGLSQEKLQRYLDYADAWGDGKDYKDPDTQTVKSNADLLNELLWFERGVLPEKTTADERKEFRRNVVMNTMRFYKNPAHTGKPLWSALEPHIWRAFEERHVLPQKDEDMLAVISFAKKETTELERKHTEFLERLEKRGYTKRQARRVVEWFIDHVD